MEKKNPAKDLPPVYSGGLRSTFFGIVVPLVCKHASLESQILVQKYILFKETLC